MDGMVWTVIGGLVLMTASALGKLFLEHARLKERVHGLEHRTETAEKAIEKMPELVDRMVEGLAKGFDELRESFDRHANNTQAELRELGEGIAYIRGQTEAQGRKVGP